MLPALYVCSRKKSCVGRGGHNREALVRGKIRVCKGQGNVTQTGDQFVVE